MNQPDDMALVRQIQHGDEAAMETFYERFAPGLTAFIRRKVGDSHDIEDILAETMTAAVSAIMRFKGESAVFTWLCRIASFKMADYYRKKNSQECLSMDEATLSIRSEDIDLETNLMIWQALNRLNQEYRGILQDKYMNGYSVREIAQKATRTEKAVESILVRARQAFEREFRRIAPEWEG